MPLPKYTGGGRGMRNLLPCSSRVAVFPASLARLCQLQLWAELWMLVLKGAGKRVTLDGSDIDN